MNNKDTLLPAFDRRQLLISAMVGSGVAVLPTAPVIAETAASSGSLPPLTVQATEGPYYLPLNLLRADITEGISGIPIDIRFTVVDEAGSPYVGALVDIWHCNAQGIYSGFQQPGGHSGEMANMTGKTFLRGVQPVDTQGNVVFHSVYPGWYHGRTTHIHFKVRRADRTNLTSQFFLPDTLSEFLYSQIPAYQRVELRDTLNSNDGIAIEAGDSVEGSVRETKGRYLVTLLVRVDRTATAPQRQINDPRGRPSGPPFEGFKSPGDRSGSVPRGRGGRSQLPPHPEVLQGKERIAALLPDAMRIDHHKDPGDPPPF